MKLTLENLRNLIALRAQADAYKQRAEQARDAAMQITQRLSFTPSGGGVHDKIGEAVANANEYATIAAEMAMEIEDRIRRMTAQVEKIKDPLVKACVIYHFFNGLSWRQTASKIGGGNTEDGCRMAVNRYFDETCSVCSTKM